MFMSTLTFTVTPWAWDSTNVCINLRSLCLLIPFLLNKQNLKLCQCMRTFFHTHTGVYVCQHTYIVHCKNMRMGTSVCVRVSIRDCLISARISKKKKKLKFQVIIEAKVSASVYSHYNRVCVCLYTCIYVCVCRSVYILYGVCMYECICICKYVYVVFAIYCDAATTVDIVCYFFFFIPFANIFSGKFRIFSGLVSMCMCVCMYNPLLL